MNHYKETKKLKEKLGLKNRPTRFSTLVGANRAVEHSVNPSFIVLGCDGFFWVVCGADFNKLLKQGYSAA